MSSRNEYDCDYLSYHSPENVQMVQAAVVITITLEETVAVAEEELNVIDVVK